jgi:hypothetical protein
MIVIMGFNALKKGTIIAALGLSVSLFAPIASNEVAAAKPTAAQDLVDSLKALNLDHVDYLYAYLQSVDLTNQEYNSIVANAKEVSKMLSSVSSPEQLSNADRAKVGRLFLDSAQKAHLQVAFVDKDGKALDLSSLTLKNAKSFFIQIKDLKGNVLASINPTLADFAPAALNTKLKALDNAVKAKKQLEKSGEFVPMPSSELPNTASDLPLGIALGGLLVILGGVAFVPAMRTVRRMENQA